MKHLIDPMDLSVEDIDRLLDRADFRRRTPLSTMNTGR